jgi:ABC-type multidrug transport system ATPase subunit
VSQATPMLRATGVTKYYGRKPALNGVSLEVPPGVHVLVLGPNGAGKTTLIKSVMGLIRYKGTIEVNGIDSRKHNKEAKRLIGYVPQSYALYDSMSVKDHAKFTARLKGVPPSSIDEPLALVNMAGSSKKKVRELSSGMRQRLGIALGLIGDPPFLILDEPTSNVDLQGRFEFQKILDKLLQRGKTMLSTTHFAGLGEMATHVVIMDKGKVIASGNPQSLLSKLNVSSTVYVKVGGGNSSAATELMRKVGATEIRQEEGWTAVTLPPEARMTLISELVKNNFKLEDVVVERMAIESEYLKLLEAGQNN